MIVIVDIPCCLPQAVKEEAIRKLEVLLPRAAFLPTCTLQQHPSQYSCIHLFPVACSWHCLRHLHTPQYPHILCSTPCTLIGLLAWESHFLLFNDLCGPGITLATGATRIAIANQCGHMILCFATASFKDGNSVSSCSCNLRITCSPSPVQLSLCTAKMPKPLQ